MIIVIKIIRQIISTTLNFLKNSMKTSDGSAPTKSISS